MATGAINLSGFNGIDFNAVLDAVMQSESIPLANLQNDQKAVQDKDSALSQLGTQIGKLQSVVKSLVSPGAFTNVATASSDTTIVTTTQGSEAVTGHYDIDITQLAKAQVTTSTNGYAATSSVAADGGTISFTIAGETTASITVTQSTTLAQLKELINNQGSGVVASIVNTGSTNKLVISSRSTGEAKGFVINNSLTNSGGPALAFAAGQSTTTGNTQDAKNAEFTVNGLDIESASNTVSGAIPGVSINLVKKGAASVDVTASFDDLKGTVQTLVSEYNKLRDFYVKQSAPDSTGKRGPLANDSVMRQALSDIRTTLLTANSNGGRYKYLSEIGIELTTNGNLKFTEAKFNTAMTDYAGDVSKLFQGSTGDGVFDMLKKRLDNLDSTAGLIKTTRDSVDATLRRYSTRISDQQSRLELRRQELSRMYQAADQAMSQISSMSSSLSSILAQQF